MKKYLSKYFTLNARDFLKGLYLAIITAVLTFFTELYQGGGTIEAIPWKRLALFIVIAFLSYLIKNLVTNSNDEILKKESNLPTK
jgi:hypothetical protein